METKKTPALLKAEAKLEAAKRRLETREEERVKRLKSELEDKLKNFDTYVASVVDAKLAKVAAAKNDKKKNRLRDDALLIEKHYKDVRANMIKSAEQKMKGSYKQPLYLVEAQRVLAAVEAEEAAALAQPKSDRPKAGYDSGPDTSSGDSGISLFVAAHMPSTACSNPLS